MNGGGGSTMARHGCRQLRSGQVAARLCLRPGREHGALASQSWPVAVRQLSSTAPLALRDGRAAVAMRSGSMGNNGADAAGTVIQRGKKGEMQKSAKVRNWEALRTADGLEDVGLIPDTFVWPGLRYLRTLTAKQQWTIVARWLRSRVINAVSTFELRWVSGIRPRPRLQRRSRAKIAADLTMMLTSAYQENNVKEIRRLCAEGLHGELREKLASKPKSEILRLGMRVRRKRVLSDRTMIIPAEYADGDQKARLRQAVVRLTVQQGLKRFGERSLAERIQFETERQRLFGSAGVVGTGAAALAAAASARAGAAPADIRIASPEQAAAEKSWVAQRGGQAYHVVHTVPDHVSVQYVVIQQRILFGQQQDWKLWGFVQPTSIESLEKANVLARSTGATSFREKLSELVGTRTG